MKLPSVMEHAFSMVPRASIPRSSFDRSHGLKTTFDAGYLVPIYVDEALPGDTFSLNLTAFARLTTPLRPIMDNMFMEFFFFAVPIRLIWDNWQHFNGEQLPGSLNPIHSTDFIVPTMNSGAGVSYQVSTLHDYLSLPILVNNVTHCSFWHRSYNLCWNEWFRDENLQLPVVVDKDDGPDAPADYVLLRRGKRHDYFTSCLPWPQKGDSVTIPLGSTAPVVSTGANVSVTFAGGAATTITGTGVPGAALTETGASGAGAMQFGAPGATTTGLRTDLTTATAATINQLRQSFQIQKLYERDARGGTRYTEILRSHFGVVSPDQRLQRPEYLGGGSVPIITSSSINTNASTPASSTGFGSTTAGPLPASAVGHARGVGFTKSFTEHCVLLGLVSVRADLTYQQGLPRMFSRSTRWDFYWPALAQIGEQAVLNKEIFYNNDANDNLVFGYQERYAEYRYKQSQITGLFRSQVPVGTFDLWHLSQEFGALPALNSSFIQETPPVDRVVAVPSEPDFIYDSYIRLKCARPMPVFGVPGLIDHF